jgi:hypothetical protein
MDKDQIEHYFQQNPDMIIRSEKRPGERGLCYLQDWRDKTGAFWGTWFIKWEPEPPVTKEGRHG